MLIIRDMLIIRVITMSENLLEGATLVNQEFVRFIVLILMIDIDAGPVSEDI